MIKKNKINLCLGMDLSLYGDRKLRLLISLRQPQGGRIESTNPNRVSMINNPVPRGFASTIYYRDHSWNLWARSSSCSMWPRTEELILLGWQRDINPIYKIIYSIIWELLVRKTHFLPQMYQGGKNKIWIQMAI